MPKYIEREAVLEWFKPYTHEDIMLEPVDVIADIRAIPAADVVEVVRCRECKRFLPCKEVEGVSWTGFCKYGEFHTDEDDFCSRGERKEDVNA